MLSSTLLCLVLSITDGDTLVASCDHHQIVVKIAEIDAPEKLQDFGLRSKQSLIELCRYKNAEITKKTIDRFGRTIAYVNCEGIDAGSEQLNRGLAWVFDKYVTDAGLYEYQNRAKSAHKGLWKQDDPIPPWEWRKTNK